MKDWTKQKTAPTRVFNIIRDLIGLGLVKVNENQAKDAEDRHMSMPKDFTDCRGYVKYEMGKDGKTVKMLSIQTPNLTKARKLMEQVYKDNSEFINISDGMINMYFYRRLNRKKEVVYNSVVCGYEYTNINNINQELLKLIEICDKNVRDYDYNEFFK